MSVSPPLLGSAAAASVSLLPIFWSLMASEEVESELPLSWPVELSSRDLLAGLPLWGLFSSIAGSVWGSVEMTERRFCSGGEVVMSESL